MFYNRSVNETLNALKSSKDGLTSRQISKRLIEYGFNELKKEKGFSVIGLFFRQFNDFLVLVLFIALIVSLFLNNNLEAITIGAILVLNAILGFVQEYKANKALVLLRSMISMKAKVIRDKVEKVIPVRELVVGDIIVVEEGDKVPADARIIEQVNLQTQEASLTGESTPVVKSDMVLKGKVDLADQSNMVFSGTTIVSGRAKAVVTATGMNTEFGKIAGLVQKIKEEETTLHLKFKEFGKLLALVIIGICFLIFFIGVYRDISLVTMFMTAIALAVSAIPEGMPIVITLALALGAHKILKKKSLVKKLKSIETLGEVTVICSDKTGTLTKNEMTVKELFVNNNIKVTGSGYEIKGDFLLNGKKININSLKLLLKISANCNNSVLESFVGDPTELALMVLAKKGNVDRDKNRVGEIPFNASKRFMKTIYRVDNKEIGYLKGAPEVILDMCDYYNINGITRRLNDNYRNFILKENNNMTSKALRVLGVAYEESGKVIFTGLIGMIDPPRREVKEAIKLCKIAGIKVVMVTGDHKNTAKAIADEIGISGGVLEGKNLDSLNDYELSEVIKKTSVFARVSSEHKVRLLNAYQRANEIVAMTGDGVNDAPALKKANVGIAMSIKGTDVSRDAADIVLVDDNFSTIVSAIKEGRIIYDNIKKFLKFLLSVNFDEILLVLFSIIAGLPLPLLPLQILWINLITDSLPALALGVDTPQSNVMRRKPRNVKESLFEGMWDYILIGGILAFLVCLYVYLTNYQVDIVKARTMVLTTAVIFEFFFVFSFRDSKKTIFEMDFFSNMFLIWAVVISLGLHLLLLYTPLSVAFSVVPLGFMDWLKIILLSTVGLVFFEVKKLVVRLWK